MDLLSCYQFDPVHDPRWAEFIRRHPKASVFHTAGWLTALRHTYGYDPVAFTTSDPNSELKNSLVFCSIESWVTGRRLVSLPFSDHCEPLCDSSDDLIFLLRHVQAAMEVRNLRYLELRPVNENFGQATRGAGFQPVATFLLHILDLHPDLDEVRRSLDKDSVQRRIHRAERAGLTEKCGRSDDLLKEFYGLFVITRGRHQLPPIPHAWFRNLIQSLGDALEIRVAYKDKTPIAGILILRYRDAVHYKYGCSDARFNQFGATPWLLWRAVATAKSNGATKFDMGRTDEDNPGLITFKNHWVAQPDRLTYWRFPETASLNSGHSWKVRMAKQVFSSMPDGLRTLAGRFIYKHIG